MSDDPNEGKEEGPAVVRFALSGEPSDVPVNIVVRGAPVSLRLSSERGEPVRTGVLSEAGVYDEQGRLLERVCLSGGVGTIHAWPHKKYAIAVNGVYVDLT